MLRCTCCRRDCSWLCCDMVRLKDHNVIEMSIKLPVIFRAVVVSLKFMLSQEYLLLLSSFLLLRSYSTASVSKCSGHLCYRFVGCSWCSCWFWRPSYCWLPAVAGVAVELKFLLWLVILLLLSLCSCCHPALAVALILHSLCSCIRSALAVVLLLMSPCSCCRPALDVPLFLLSPCSCWSPCSWCRPALAVALLMLSPFFCCYPALAVTLLLLSPCSCWSPCS